MDDISLMDGLDTDHDLVEDSDGFVKTKYSLGQFGLILKEVPQVAVLHNDEVVATI